RSVRPDRSDDLASGPARRGRERGERMSPEAKHAFWHDIWVQLPFLVWLIALWMLLWGQFTVLAFVTGLIVAFFVTRVFRLPTVSLGGRLNLWYSAIFIVRFLWAVMLGSFVVAGQVWNFR